MGNYLNPTKMSKESFLEKYGVEIFPEQYFKKTYKELRDENKTLFVKIDNGLFIAVLICDRESEYDYVEQMILKDTRPLNYYLVEDKDLPKGD